jgi:hypothetical protein
MQPAVSFAGAMPDDRNGQNTPTGLVFRGNNRFFEARRRPDRAFVQLMHNHRSSLCKVQNPLLPGECPVLPPNIGGARLCLQDQPQQVRWQYTD